MYLVRVLPPHGEGRYRRPQRHVSGSFGAVYNLIIDPKQIVMSAEADYLDATVTAPIAVFDYDETEMKRI
ncbi:MAG: hypothetical protein ACLUD2_14485 [Clostridium sp.]